jgi:diguanylate cyclase
LAAPSAPTFDVCVEALAVVLAVLACEASLTAAKAVCNLGTRRRACRLTLYALAAGFGLWAAATLQALAVVDGVRLAAGPAGLLRGLAVACTGELCALVFLARRNLDSAALAGSALSFAAGVAATEYVAFLEMLSDGRLDPAAQWARLGGCAALACAGFAMGLRLAIAKRLRGRRRPPAVQAAVACLLGGAMLVPQAGMVLGSRFAARSCCASTGLEPRLLALAIAAVGTAVLLVMQVTVRLGIKFHDLARRSRHDLEEAHARLHHIATHDVLTGLPNRNLLKERLARALADAPDRGHTVAIAALDLDQFSALNHSLGHGVGDNVLAEIARRLESAVAEAHMLARVGGDSFALLIDSVSARMEALAVTRAMLAELERPLHVNGEEIRARLSIGVSMWPADASRGDDLLAHAEAALNAAKRAGGGRVLFFDPSMSDSMRERVALENDLRRALAVREFEIHYQPLLSTHTGKVVSVEALLRWRHPLKGLITPSSFIPLAEQTGLIVPLDEWVLREVCRQARTWLDESGLELRVAVNLSAMQFRHRYIVDLILSAVNAAGLDPRMLELELTESTLMTDLDKSAAALKLLRAMGVSIAIDDFGTGYSSLSYLRRLPIDKLKIDRSFVRDLTSSRTDESIVRAIVSLAHSVGLQVVAEGVETEEQLERIRALECDQWQGYYCCTPQPSEKLVMLLEERGAASRTGIVAALTRASRLLSP